MDQDNPVNNNKSRNHEDVIATLKMGLLVKKLVKKNHEKDNLELLLCNKRYEFKKLQIEFQRKIQYERIKREEAERRLNVSETRLKELENKLRETDKRFEEQNKIWQDKLKNNLIAETIQKLYIDFVRRLKIVIDYQDQNDQMEKEQFDGILRRIIMLKAENCKQVLNRDLIDQIRELSSKAIFNSVQSTPQTPQLNTTITVLPSGIRSISPIISRKLIKSSIHNEYSRQNLTMITNNPSNYQQTRSFLSPATSSPFSSLSGNKPQSEYSRDKHIVDNVVFNKPRTSTTNNMVSTSEATRSTKNAPLIQNAIPIPTHLAHPEELETRTSEVQSKKVHKLTNDVFSDKPLRMVPMLLPLHITTKQDITSTSQMQSSNKICDKSATKSASVGRQDHAPVKSLSPEESNQNAKLHNCKCGNTYLSRGALLLHIKTMKLGYIYACMTCGRGFKQLASVKKHMRSIHDDIYTGFHCRLCKAQFSSSKPFRLHRLKEHNL